eukprot:1056748-Prymnesium_polylepis.1
MSYPCSALQVPTRGTHVYKRVVSKLIQVPIALRTWAEWREEVLRERPAAQHVTECGLVCREQKLHEDAAAAPIRQQQLP